MSRPVEVADEWLKRIKEQLVGVQYGVIQITIHNGQIVQIDRTERSRYDTEKSPSAARKQR
ncbi:YezD family protein [Paenibacillus sp. PL91]|uniref:YezD family protein n=1 Tax=Paenibacillus sp. PL91 TaxID=2729538 RepID=UPI00145C5C7E|nr:YezD family protein [Paenibacillus sp. PL91]MBC9204395.1 YezD family protein [Paenibacillus sp. PL91]